MPVSGTQAEVPHWHRPTSLARTLCAGRILLLLLCEYRVSRVLNAVTCSWMGGEKPRGLCDRAEGPRPRGAWPPRRVLWFASLTGSSPPSVLLLLHAPVCVLGCRSKEPLQDNVIATYEEHEDSVYAVDWSSADPWLFASLSYDGRLVINRVPRALKYHILL